VTRVPPGNLRLMPLYKGLTRPLVSDPVFSAGEPVPSHLTPNPPTVTYDGDKQEHTRDYPAYISWWRRG
jgi:hypothetical protein